MSHELLPCPFCGSEAKRITLKDEENFGGDVIICQNCDACSRVVFGEKEGLVEAWNRRATQPAAAHGDEAVRFESPEALAKAISDHCGYAEVNSELVAGRIFAAMRAQGDGEVQ